MIKSFLNNNFKFNSKVTGAKSSSVTDESNPPILCPKTRQEFRKRLDLSRSGRKTQLQRHTTIGSADPKSFKHLAAYNNTAFGEASLEPIAENGPLQFDREYTSQSRQGVAWNTGTTMSATTQFASSKVEEQAEDMHATDELRSDGLSAETGLEQFLSRPVKIYETTWEVGSALREYSLYPWQLFLRDPVIASKVNNYAWIQGKMHIKVLINGTQWHYGKSLLSYRPLPSTCELQRSPGNAQFVDNIAFSQRPNVVLDPTESEAGELVLPFMWYYNWLNLAEDQELQDMGELVLSSYNVLANAAGGTEGVSISIFAYMSDVKMSGPTSYQSQSGGMKDEYGDGVVSQPASAVAKFARMLTSVPMIGPFARATEIGAEAVSKVAKIFGYSRPINVSAIEKYRPTYMGNMANSSIPEAVDKLALDPKQEVSIDPRITGYNCSEDDLNIKKIAMKESYIGKFRWSNTNLVNALLWNANVTPRLWDTEDNVTLGEVYHLTPMCLLQQCFTYWRGSVEFRFDIAASKFHKGRLRFVWDPLGTGSSVPDWAANFNRVIDLSQERSFSMKIGMNQAAAFLGGSASLQNANENFSPTYEVTTPVVLGGNGDANGVLRCYVLNELVAPDDATEPVEINVFVKMCDDAEFAYPREGFGDLAYISQSYTSQSEEGSSPPTEPPTTQAEIPIMDIISENEVDTTDLVHFGESITSLRALMKRYQYATTRSILTDRSLGTYSYGLSWPDFPASPGESSTNVLGPQKLTLMGLFTPCFAARRGGIRWKYNLIDPSRNIEDGVITEHNSEFTVWRRSYTQISPTTGPFTVTTVASGAAVTVPDDRDIINAHPETTTGAYVTLQNHQNAVEVELPYQTNKRFQVGKLVKASDGSRGWSDGHRMTFQRPTLDTTGTNFALQINAYCAIGEDFSLSNFVNVPPLYPNKDLA